VGRQVTNLAGIRLSLTIPRVRPQAVSTMPQSGGRGVLCFHPITKTHQPGCVPAWLSASGATSISTPLQHPVVRSSPQADCARASYRGPVGSTVCCKSHREGKPKRSPASTAGGEDQPFRQAFIQHAHGLDRGSKVCHCLPARAQGGGSCCSIALHVGRLTQGARPQQLCHSAAGQHTLASANGAPPAAGIESRQGLLPDPY